MPHTAKTQNQQSASFSGTAPSNQFEPRGVYRPEYEHDSCGVGFIADLTSSPRHDLVEDAVQILVNLEHRGAVGGDQATSDGAGLLLGKPDSFFRSEEAGLNFELPPFDDYAVGMVFMPTDTESAEACRHAMEQAVKTEGMVPLGWRSVPVNPDCLGKFARDTMPQFEQFFVGRQNLSPDVFERKLYVARRRAEKTVAELKDADTSSFYVASLSSKTVVYKGMLTGTELYQFFPDLTHETYKSHFAIVHQRYSTNTAPTWSLAQPFRMLAHNGEINTLHGNINRMRARESKMSSPLLGDDINTILPATGAGSSDSATIDNALELLVHGGRSLPHAMMMLVPEPWGNTFHISEDKRAFYEFHSAFMEPWDGPAALAFTDGRFIGANLDRNGLRPARYTITHDNLVVMASETGVLNLEPQRICSHGRLAPGRMLLVDLHQQRVVPDREIKANISRQAPYRHWVRDNRIELRGLLAPAQIEPEDPAVLRRKQQGFGYTEEELKTLIGPMAARGQEAVGSMGHDVPLAVLSKRPQLLFTYFKQLFAQVTNPAIDPYREELVMSLMSFIGRERNLLDETPEHCHMLKLHHPVLTPEDISRIRQAESPEVNNADIDALFRVDAEGAGDALEYALDALFHEAENAIASGATLLTLTDRNMDENHAPIPILLASSALHHHLIRKGLRTSVDIIVESGEVREVMHYAMLIAFGANAVCPHVAFSTVRELAENQLLEADISADTATDNYITAVKKGLLKTLSRMGISTIRSFHGSQIFEAVGLNRTVVDRYFTGTTSRIEGAGLDEIAREVKERYSRAYPQHQPVSEILDAGGEHYFRATGEKHLWNPTTLPLFQRAVREGDYERFKEYTHAINDQAQQHLTLRSMFDFAEQDPIPLEEVEPVESITARFFSSAMSFGSISQEAHETIAAGMNRAGARSNCGEGGEDPARYEEQPDGRNLKSKVKQVASGRFGVTTEYLINCDELQIKIAQGAKPGEGGQLPGHKVTEDIAKVRHTTPGVTLISPPPHHDIYSIEDLAQLISDLKCANARGRVSVKLVSEVGVGTIAAGVAKGQADMVQIAGYDGGTGASPMTAIKHAGIPWELGLAETQLCLRQNSLRSGIRVQVDGQLRTGRDLAIAALMGAEEFGFGTIMLVCVGCVMMRKCHANNCPVGVATQDPQLRACFPGRVEHVENFMRFLAQDLREHMAMLGFRTVDEMVGHVECLKFQRAIDHWKTQGVDLTPLLMSTDSGNNEALHCTREAFYEPVSCFDDELIQAAAPALHKGESVVLDRSVRNIHRTIGARLSGEVVKHHGRHGLPEDTIRLQLEGSAGQSLGAFLAPGVTIEHCGDANDYVGKGLNGGKIILYPPREATFTPHENVIAGNVMLYGAITGEMYVNGLVGERFGIRNSGARAVVEGIGNHGCEYMTGGVIVVLGSTGYNFAAGMSGGVAYVYDETGLFDTRCNLDMVDIETVWAAEDRECLYSMLQKQLDYTGSARARHMLEHWSTHHRNFVKVMPIEYRRVLERMSRDTDRDAETVSATEEVFD